MDSDIDIGRRIIAVREDRNLNQTEFAKKLNIAKSTLNGYETGERQLPVDKAKRIRSRFGVSLDWLLHGDIGQPGYELAVKLGPHPKIKEDAKSKPEAESRQRPRKSANR